jgi:hypothetical protein
MWMGAFLPWKTASLFRNNIWIMGCTWLSNLSTYSLTVIWLWRVIMGPTEYDIAAQAITEPSSYFTVGMRHSRFYASLRVLKHKLFLM